MFASWKSQLQERIPRQHQRMLAFVIFWMSLGVLLWSAITVRLHEANQPPIPAPSETILPDTQHVSTTAAGTSTGPIASWAEPVRLRIPTLEIDAAFETALDINDDGSIGVPAAYDTVGWYKHSPTPGELGPAVVLGHVDSREGSAVFFYLGQLKISDTIEIDRADGSTVIFSVTGYERIKQSEFPTERVYGDIPYAGIRLITCSGTYNKETQRYDHNLIVYGSLSEIRNASNGM